jgi:hypothetical protein
MLAPVRFVDFGNARTVATSRVGTNAFIMPDDACAIMHADEVTGLPRDPDFAGYSLGSQGSQAYDSCYLTQTVVYVSSDGSCFDGNLTDSFAVWL